MNAIKQYREAAGLKQAELAEKIGISTVTLSRYENDGREPRATDLLKMAELFGCSVDELLGKNPTQPLPHVSPEQGSEKAAV